MHGGPLMALGGVSKGMGRPLWGRLAGRILGSLAFLWGCEPAPTESSAEAPAARSPDIVLVSVDSLRPDHLGCYGYGRPTSPTIDRLAAEGVRCATAVSTTSWTLPAHAAMFTGLFDSAHGVVDNGLRLPEERITIAEILAEAGWRTAAFYGGPYLDPVYGLDQGFERYESCMSEEVESSHRDVTGPRTVQAIETWLGESGALPDPRPIFLFVHLWDVHHDYIPPSPYAERFDPEYDGDLDASDLPGNASIAPDMSPRDFQRLLALYDGEIRFTDENLRRILDAVERHRGQRETLLIVTSDHGEEFFEHGGKGHQRTLFDEVVRVPLLLHWPGRLPAGRVVTDQVRLVDLAPTLYALVGVVQHPPMQGRDLGPLLRGEPMEPAPALLELLVDRNDVRAWRTESLKVIDWRHAGVRSAYDLVRDPQEDHPIPADAPTSRPAIDDMERALETTSRLGAEAPAGGVRIDADLTRRLGILGYAGDPEPAGARRDK